jgi:2,4-dienoyl-CoA reductase-like NADH-dependent reductase (Old Yellow Enzyme family)
MVFEETNIRSLRLRNRFVRSATWLGMADDDGSATPRLIETTAESARHGVGLVISGYAYVRRDGQSAPAQLGAHSDDMIDGLRKVADAVHEVGGSIILQLMHGGLFSMPGPSNLPAISPSVLSTPEGDVGREMSDEEIPALTRSFAEAAVRGKEAGFDGVQIHAAHGFLLSQFLSPFFNHREDEYGGSVVNRARMPVEVIAGVRAAVGSGYPILAKINANDFLEGGFDEEQMVMVSSLLEEASVDAVELSGGTFFAYLIKQWEGFFSPLFKDGVYYKEGAKLFKEKVGVPLMLVGGIRTLEESEELVREGITDYVSLCRPLIRQPDLIQRWESGDSAPSECISDNACFDPGLVGQGVHCVHVPGFRPKGGHLKFFSASSGAINTERSVAECMENAMSVDDTDCDLLIFFTTMGHDFDKIVSEARRLAPSARVVGCTCAGVIGQEGPNQSMRALAVMAVRGKAFAVAARAGFGRDELQAVGADLAKDLKDQNPDINIILCYPSHSVHPATDMISGFEEVFGPNVPIIGGYSTDNLKLKNSFQFIDDTTYEWGALAIGLADPTLEVIAESAHGFNPMEASLEVTRSEGSRVFELDGKPAWHAFTELLGLAKTEDRLRVVAMAELAEELPPEFHEAYGSKFLIVGGALREDDDSITFNTACPVGKKLRLLERDEQGIFDSVDAIGQRITARLAGRKPVAVFHADCAARGKASFNRILKEEVIDRLQGPICSVPDLPGIKKNIPWLGMYGDGELAPLLGHNMAHTFTSSVQVIVEREDA